MTVSTTSTLSVLTNQQERTQVNADASFSPETVTSDRNDQRVAPVAQTPIAISSSPATLTAGADTALTFTATSGEAYSVRRVYVENNSDGGTPTTLYLRFDATANPGGCKIRPGEWRSFDAPCNVLHVYCAVALTLNGSADGGVTILGWL